MATAKPLLYFFMEVGTIYTYPENPDIKKYGEEKTPKEKLNFTASF